MTIVTSLPNIFDPNILLNKKTERITDLMGDNEYVLIRENITTILRHGYSQLDLSYLISANQNRVI